MSSPGGGIRILAGPSPDSRLASVLLNRDFAVTAEITPPVSGAAEALLARAEPLRDQVDAVNVTDGPRAQVHMSALAAAAILAGHGIEPVLQLTCRDRNRIALQSDLLGAAALGVRNILVLTGDQPDSDEVPPPKAVFDLGSADLIRLAAGMRDNGVLASGREITAPPNLFIGAADTPIDPAPDWQPTGLRVKIDAGAQFVQTQLCYDIGVVRRYVARLEAEGITERLFILIGIGPIASAKSARWMRENLWGVIVPDQIIGRLEGAADPKAEGIRVCAELLQQLREINGVAGAHLMAPGNVASIPEAIRQSGVRTVEQRIA